MSSTHDNNPPSSSRPDDDALWADLQRLLLDQERARVQLLEEDIEKLERRLEEIQQQIIEQEHTLVPTVTEAMSEIADQAVHDDRKGMAKALGPIIGEATRIQIRDSRDEMIEILYPVIGDSVVRAVAERLRELQRQIDARLRPGGGFFENMRLRMRGVSPGDVALRRALPFEVEQLFLIQHETGFVIEHFARNESEAADSDLISGMLTAIRSFMEDSFDPDRQSDQDLDSIYHGDANIILQSGTKMYAAAVVQGTEPAGFRAALRSLLSDLHLKYHDAIEAYDGDPESLPPLRPVLVDWVEAVERGPDREGAAEEAKKLLARWGAVLGILSLVFCCFFSWFVWRLTPVALGLSNTPAPIIQTIIITATPEPTLPPTATVAATLTATATETPDPTATYTVTPAPTATVTEEPTPTLELSSTVNPGSRINTPVWSRLLPSLAEPTYLAIEQGVEVNVLEIAGVWAKIKWVDPIEGETEGWIPLELVDLSPLDTIEENSAVPVDPSSQPPSAAGGEQSTPPPVASTAQAPLPQPTLPPVVQPTQPASVPTLVPTLVPPPDVTVEPPVGPTFVPTVELP